MLASLLKARSSSQINFLLSTSLFMYDFIVSERLEVKQAQYNSHTTVKSLSYPFSKLNKGSELHNLNHVSGCYAKILHKLNHFNSLEFGLLEIDFFTDSSVSMHLAAPLPESCSLQLFQDQSTSFSASGPLYGICQKVFWRATKLLQSCEPCSSRCSWQYPHAVKWSWQPVRLPVFCLLRLFGLWIPSASASSSLNGLSWETESEKINYMIKHNILISAGLGFWVNRFELWHLFFLSSHFFLKNPNSEHFISPILKWSRDLSAAVA